MLIILEGNECCFKTTVADKLSKRLNIPIVKGSSFEHSMCTNEELFQKFITFTEMENVIVDRFVYSNKVYATLYKDFAILSDKQREQIEELIKYKSKVFYLYADDQVIEERIRLRGDDYVNVDMVSKINREFSQAISDSNLNVTWYDTSEWTSDEIVEEIIKDFNN